MYRPHTGVDYAAPKGTPVHAVADGVVTFKGWGGGGGNTLKIKHAGNLMTGYLHLSGYAKGISKGSRVSQGQLIGYVGSTGASTGPHLDYRIWTRDHFSPDQNTLIRYKAVTRGVKTLDDYYNSITEYYDALREAQIREGGLDTVV